MDLATLLLTRASKFSGTDGEVWEKWVCRFEAQTGPLNDEERLSVLVGLLEGSALDVFVSLSPESRKKYKCVVGSLGERFGRQVSPLQAHAELSKVHQSPSESIENFAARIKELGTIAHPNRAGGDGGLQEFLCSRFICGLRDTRLQEKLSSKNIQTLAEAVRVSKEFEKNRNAVLTMQRDAGEVGGAVSQSQADMGSGTTANRDWAGQGTADRISTIESQLREIKESVAAIATTRTSEGPKPARLPRCYRCGIDGHFQRECPQRIRAAPSRRCFGCGEEGHIRRNCHRVSTSSNNHKPTTLPTCLCCGRDGHWMAECQFYQGGAPAGGGPQTSPQGPRQSTDAYLGN